VDIFPNNGGNPCPEAGTSCDDGDPNTINDVEDGNCNCEGIAQSGTLNIVVSEDAEEGESGAMYLDSSDLELVFDSFNSQNNQTVGLRFDNIPLPSNAVINNAYIQFTVDETDSGLTNLTIDGEYNGDASFFTTNSNDLSNRTTTSSQNEVSWPNVPSWNSVGQSGSNQQTPDLSGIIAEILGHSGWTENNAMVFFITGTGTRTAESRDGSLSGAARLIINYDLNAGPVCNAPVNLSTSSVSPSGVDISWTPESSASNGYEWVVMPSGITPSVINAIASGSVNSTTFTDQVDGLNSSTNYDAYVRSACDSDLVSAWSSPITFVTLNENGDLICNSPQNFNSNNLAGSTGVELSWDLNSTATNGYEWIIMNEGQSPDAASAFLTGTVSNTLNSVDVYGLQQGASYDIYIRSICDNVTFSSWSDVITLSTYCQAGAIDQDYEKIEFVSLNTISNSSTFNGGYEDFTDIYTTLSRGSTYGFQATDDDSYDEDQLIVWIDFNQDSDFEDTGEQVLVTNGQDPWTGNITIPTSALLGPTRMRIRLHALDPWGPNDLPCGDSEYGQVEDYTVVIYDDYVYYNESWTPQSPNGISSNSDNILVVNGNPILESSTQVNNLEVLRQGSLNVENILSVNGDINNNGKITFKSDINYTAQLDEFTGSINGAGEVTVERFIPAATNNRRAFRFLSTAVDTNVPIYQNWQEKGNSPEGYGTHISGSVTGDNGFDPTGTGNPSMFTLNQTTNLWDAVPNTDQMELIAGEGYLLLIRGDRNYDMTNGGPPNSDVVLRATGSLISGTHIKNTSEIEGYFSLVGNPYQSIVDYNLLTSNNINPNFIWVWDPNLSNKGAYVTVSIPSGFTTSGITDVSQFIQPGHAFIVQTLNNGSSSITFEEEAKSVDQLPAMVFSSAQLPRIKLLLYTNDNYLNGASESDGLVVNFNPNGNNAVDELDAYKLNNTDENLARRVNSTDISIENRALPVDGEILEIFTNGYTDAQYILDIEVQNMSDGIKAYFIDSYTNSSTLLNSGYNQVSFNVIEEQPLSLASDRFKIIFENTTLGVSDNNGFGDGFKLFPVPSKDGLFKVSTIGLSSSEVNLSIYDIAGKKVYSKLKYVDNNGIITADASILGSGIFIVEVTQGQKKYTEKLIIE